MAFKADTDDLKTLSSSFITASEDVRTLNGKLKAPPDISTENDWGAAEAATSYIESRDSWVASLDQLVASLACIGQKLSIAAELYAQTELAATVTEN